MRFNFTKTVIVLIILLMSCSNPIKFKLISNNSNYNENHNQTIDFNFPDTLIQLWQTAVNAGFTKHSIVQYDSLIFVSNLKGEIKLFRIEDGKRIGTLSYKKPIFSSLQIIGNILIFATGFKDDDESKLIFYDLLSGDEINSINLCPKIENQIVKFKDHIFVVCENGLVAKYDKIGNKLWDLKLDDQIVCDPVIFAENLFLGSKNGRLYKIDASSRKIECIFNTKNIINTITAKDGCIYVSDNTGTLWKINNENGSIVWKISIGKKSFSNPIIENDIIYIANVKGDYLALKSSDGNTIWKTELNNLININSLIFQNYILVPMQNKKLILLNKETGKFVNEFGLEGRPRTNPLVCKNKLFIGIEDDIILCLKLF